MLPNFLDPILPAGVRPFFNGKLYTPEEVAAGNDSCLIDCPQPVLLNISVFPHMIPEFTGDVTNFYVYFPAGNGQPWAISCIGWGVMLNNGAMASPGQSTNIMDFLSAPPNVTLGPVLQGVIGANVPSSRALGTSSHGV